MVSYKIKADDPRNPSYYRLRAGYPEPDQLFYEGRKNANEPRQLVAWSKENFVRGYNLTCGEFYRFREAMAPYMIEKELYKENLKDVDKKWDLYEAYEKAHKHELLENSKAPAYWRRKMIPLFFTGYLQNWLDKHELFIDHTLKSKWTMLPRDSSWVWPSSATNKFDGYFQYQHLTINIETEPNGNDRYETICEVKVRDIIDRALVSPSIPISPHDVELNRILLDLLHQRLKDHLRLLDFSSETHDIRYRDPDSENRWLRIYDDSSLQDALAILRVKMQDHIQFFIFEVTPTLDAQNVRELPKKNKRKRGQNDNNSNRKLRKT